MLPNNEQVPFLEEFDQHTSGKRSNFIHRWRLSKSRPEILSASLWRHVLICIITSLFWVTIIILLTIYKPRTNYSSIQKAEDLGVSTNFTGKSELLKCGRSTTEAKEMGCQYDILSNHWVPGPCMDQEAVEEYQMDKSWYGFADENRTQHLSIDAMSEMEYYYTSERDHIVHCAMLWRKQFRAFYEERKHLDTVIGSFKHTMHCSQFLIDMSERGPDYRNMPIKTWVGYAGCWVRE